MNRYLAAYLATAVVMLAVDMVWLGVVARSLYQEAIGHLMAERPGLPAAAAFYALFPAGLVLFAVAPQIDDPGWTRTLVMGALFGFFAYATYDLTNLATLRNWPIRLALIDIAWGAAISGVAAGAGRLAAHWASRG